MPQAYRRPAGRGNAAGQWRRVPGGAAYAIADRADHRPRARQTPDPTSQLPDAPGAARQLVRELGAQVARRVEEVVRLLVLDPVRHLAQLVQLARVGGQLLQGPGEVV